LIRLPEESSAASQEKTMRSCYKVLGIDAGATSEQVKKAYRDLAKEWHPDRNVSPGATSVFQGISQAFETLMDPVQRREHDASLRRQENQSHADVFFRPGVFAAEFAPRFSASKSSVQRDATRPFIPVKCTLEELLSGATKKLAVARRRLRQGKLVKESHTFIVEIVPGSANGDLISFPHEGDQFLEPGQQANDVVFVVHEVKHPTLQRQGSTLVCQQHISLLAALLRSPLQMTDIDGQPLQVDLLNDRLCPGFVKVLPGHGMVCPNKRERGDLHIEFIIDFPTEPLSREQQELLAAALQPPETATVTYART
jgi:DnaJ-class molecular chaperone